MGKNIYSMGQDESKSQWMAGMRLQKGLNCAVQMQEQQLSHFNRSSDDVLQYAHLISDTMEFPLVKAKHVLDKGIL